MTGFIQFLNRLEIISNEAEQALTGILAVKSFKKGQYILRPGEVCDKLIFMDNGLAKTSFKRQDKIFIMRFFPEGSLFTLLDSYSNSTPSRYSIQAIEPATITSISRSDWNVLAAKYPELEKCFGKLTCLAATNMMQRISEMLEENASERYNHFVNENAALLQRISLGDLANYLGITQVSLSRIRLKR